MDNDSRMLMKQFIGWQCRIRQHVVRKNQGIPSQGMRPDLYIDGIHITTLNVQIVKSDADEIIQELRFMVKKTQDPQARYENALKYFSEYYYQLPEEFSDQLTAVFPLYSALAKRLNTVGHAELRFFQGNQDYCLACTVSELVESDETYQATYWHNSLFNPTMPGKVCMLSFQPDWQSCRFRSE